MIATVHQPEHLPWLGFFDKMRQVDIFVLLDNTQFSKRDFQNRNRVKTANGPVWLTVPVFQKGLLTQLILDVEICNDTNWRRRCWSHIYEGYRNAPYFPEHRQFFSELYARKWTKLVDLNTTIIQYLVDQLEIKTKIVRSSELKINEHGATNVLVSICRSVGADIYLSGKHGKDYLDESRFVEHNIQVKYQDFRHPLYPQLNGDFISNMSVIDLLFNCGAKSLDIIADSNSHVGLEAGGNNNGKANFGG